VALGFVLVMSAFAFRSSGNAMTHDRPSRPDRLIGATEPVRANRPTPPPKMHTRIRRDSNPPAGMAAFDAPLHRL
jgi:hypothetical protein